MSLRRLNRSKSEGKEALQKEGTQEDDQKSMSRSQTLESEQELAEHEKNPFFPRGKRKTKSNCFDNLFFTGPFRKPLNVRTPPV